MPKRSCFQKAFGRPRRVGGQHVPVAASARSVSQLRPEPGPTAECPRPPCPAEQVPEPPIRGSPRLLPLGGGVPPGYGDPGRGGPFKSLVLKHSFLNHAVSLPAGEASLLRKPQLPGADTPPPGRHDACRPTVSQLRTRRWVSWALTCCYPTAPPITT